MKADLHSHTKYSDGVLTVIELLEIAKSKKLDVFAITDHDCFDGATEAYKIQEEFGIKMIFGMELSTYSNDESVHVLAYYPQPINSGKLYEMLENQRINRKKRAYEILELLKKHFNIDLDSSFIEKKHSVTRGTMADEIIKQGFARDKATIFKTILGDNCPCYIPSTKLSTKEGIELILESGGMPVLAHPCLYKKNSIEDLIKLGVKGIEAVYPRKENRETKFRDIARKYNLVVTAGSDFHLPNDYSHGNVGDAVIKDLDVRKFLKVLEDEY